MKRIGELPFEYISGLRCVGAPNPTKSSDEILMLGQPDYDLTEAVM